MGIYASACKSGLALCRRGGGGGGVVVVSFWVTESSKLVHFVILIVNDLILGCMSWRYSVL